MIQKQQMCWEENQASLWRFLFVTYCQCCCCYYRLFLYLHTVFGVRLSCTTSTASRAHSRVNKNEYGMKKKKQQKISATIATTTTTIIMVFVQCSTNVHIKTQQISEQVEVVVVIQAIILIAVTARLFCCFIMAVVIAVFSVVNSTYFDDAKHIKTTNILHLLKVLYAGFVLPQINKNNISNNEYIQQHLLSASSCHFFFP